MSASDDIWILGIHMTKFGKHPDKDTVDLGAEAIKGALADAGVSMRDIGVLAAGNLMGRGGIGQQLQKQVAQAVSILNEKERFIVERRITSDDPLTLQEIAVNFSISRERVRQIEARGLSKLKTLVEEGVGEM